MKSENEKGGGKRGATGGHGREVACNGLLLYPHPIAFVSFTCLDNYFQRV